MILRSLALFSMFIGGAVSIADAKEIAPNLDGLWQGTFRLRDPRPADQPRDDFQLTLMISGKKVRVFQKTKQLLEISKKLKVLQTGPNGVISFTVTDPIPPTDWVETWSIVFTAADNDTLVTEWTRVVNNLTLAPPNPESEWSDAAYGTLKRMDESDGT